MEHEDFQVKVLEGLTRLETHMEVLIGNGQPGKITLMENDINDLKQKSWKTSGIVIGISGVLSAVGAAIHFLFPSK